MARAIRPNTRAIVITTPNNPTGYVVDARIDAPSRSRANGLWLFADEVYRGSEGDPPTIFGVAISQRGVSLGAMAKVYGLAGLHRPDRDARRRSYAKMAAFKDYLTICNPAPSEYLATLAIRHHDALVERVRTIAAANLDRLDAFFAKHRDRWEWHRPRAGTTAFPRYLAGSTEKLCAELVERAGVLLLPSAAFDAGDDRVRLGYGRKNLPEALTALDEFLH